MKKNRDLCDCSCWYWKGVNISETDKLLEFSHTTLSSLHRQKLKKKHPVSVESGGLVVKRDQRKMSSLVWADRKDTVTQAVTLFSCGKLKSMLEHTTHQTFHMRCTLSCQSRTKIWGYHKHRLTQIGHFKTVKELFNFPVPMIALADRSVEPEVVFCCCSPSTPRSSTKVNHNVWYFVHAEMLFCSLWQLRVIIWATMFCRAA